MELRAATAKHERPGSDAYGGSGLSVRPFFMFAQIPSELSRSVDVGAVFDGQDSDHVTLVVDAVDHAVVAAPGAVQPGQAELEWLADPVRIGGQGAVQEFHRCGCGLLGQPGQRTAGRGGPRDREVALAHRSVIRRSASSLLSTCASLSARASRISSRRAALSMTPSVSSSDSRSSRLMTTAAGWPCLVITTRPCSFCRRSTTSESRFFTSASDICSVTDMTISIASFLALARGSCRSLGGVSARKQRALSRRVARVEKLCLP